MYYSKNISFLFSLFLLTTACEDIPRCNDGILNNDETEIDCGGICGPCYTCEDGILNQDEHGVDCGGSCQPCKDNAIAIQVGREGTIIQDVVFINDEVGYIAADFGNLYKTTDGGQTIQELTLPSPILFKRNRFQIYFWDTHIGYYQGYSQDAQERNTIYYTRDGGNFWQQSKWAKHREDILDIVFTDEKTGVMGTQYRNPNNANELEGFLYRTIDGGANWVQVLETASFITNQSTRFPLENIEALGAGKILATSNNLIFISQDNGATWKVQTSNSIDLVANSLQMVDEELGYAIKEKDNVKVGLHKTENGGLNWKIIPFKNTIPSEGINPEDFHFCSANKAYLALSYGHKILFQWNETTADWENLGSFDPAIFPEGDYPSRVLSITDNFAYVGTYQNIVAKIPLIL